MRLAATRDPLRKTGGAFCFLRELKFTRHEIVAVFGTFTMLCNQQLCLLVAHFCHPPKKKPTCPIELCCFLLAFPALQCRYHGISKLHPGFVTSCKEFMSTLLRYS